MEKPAASTTASSSCSQRSDVAGLKTRPYTCRVPDVAGLKTRPCTCRVRKDPAYLVAFVVFPPSSFQARLTLFLTRTLSFGVLIGA